jgi:hypothetical protein
MNRDRTAVAGARLAPEVPLWRLYVLRAMYLVMAVGLGAMILPEIFDHEMTSRGVLPSLFAGLWVLALFGLRYPLAMLPMLLFELVWKAIWMAAYGLPQWLSGQRPPTFADDFFNIAFGAVLLVVIPWGHVWKCYIRQPAERWR